MLNGVVELVSRRIVVSNTQEIEAIAKEVCIELEKPLGKIYDDFMQYSDLERLLIADLIAYKFLQAKKLSTSLQNSQALKKVKADVVEVEYDNTFQVYEATLQMLEKEICSKAELLCISLSICQCAEIKNLPFKVFV